MEGDKREVFKMKHTFFFVYMLWLINSSPHLQTTTQMTF